MSWPHRRQCCPSIVLSRNSDWTVQPVSNVTTLCNSKTGCVREQRPSRTGWASVSVGNVVTRRSGSLGRPAKALPANRPLRRSVGHLGKAGIGSGSSGHEKKQKSQCQPEPNRRQFLASGAFRRENAVPLHRRGIRWTRSLYNPGRSAFGNPAGVAHGSLLAQPPVARCRDPAEASALQALPR